mmetsp:Transcript_6442/g.15177  ORF Transcript_6442/g.15177 Transcript_6442/m.15177 type:complete len:353 (-) Transcript_6442:12-1070(-)
MSLEDEVARLREENDRLREENDRLEEANQTFSEDLEQLFNENEELEERMRDMTGGGGDAAQSEKVIQELTNELSLMRDTHKDLREDLGAKENEVDQLQAQVKELTSDMTKMRKKADMQNTKFESLTRKHQELTRKHEDHVLGTDRERTGGNMDKESTIDALHQQVELLRQQLTAEESRTNQVMEELMTVANQKDEEHARCNKYQADLDEKEDELQVKVVELDDEQRRYEQEFKNNEDLSMELEKNLTEWNNQRTALETAVAEGKKKLAALEIQNKELKDTTVIGEKEKDIEILKEQMRRHADQLAAVQSERDTALEDLDVVNMVLADLSAQAMNRELGMATEEKKEIEHLKK